MSRKVQRVTLHTGGLHGKTGYDATKDKTVAEMTPYGVLIKEQPGKIMELGGKRVYLLVPNANCSEVLVDADSWDAEDIKRTTEEVKRSPGRPPGPRLA